jgi:HSP20 family molecular chaperone IbpA
MHTYKNKDTSSRNSLDGKPDVTGFRTPVFECHMLTEYMKVLVYIPGVDANSVTIEARGVDLMVTALKTRFVRVNFNALNLESAQYDYRLCLRLGKGYAFESMHAEIQNGILSIDIPLKDKGGISMDRDLRHVA